MNILGIPGAVSHAPSAALFIDGELAAAAEEKRFIRDKHTNGKYPYEATRFCLKHAGIKPADIDVVAFPYAPVPLSMMAIRRSALVCPGSGARCPYHLIEALEELTGNCVILNTSLNRRGEPMVCSPTDALNMVFGSELQYLMVETSWCASRPEPIGSPLS